MTTCEIALGVFAVITARVTAHVMREITAYDVACGVRPSTARARYRSDATPPHSSASSGAGDTVATSSLA